MQVVCQHKDYEGQYRQLSVTGRRLLMPRIIFMVPQIFGSGNLFTLQPTFPDQIPIQAHLVMPLLSLFSILYSLFSLTYTFPSPSPIE